MFDWPGMCWSVHVLFVMYSIKCLFHGWLFFLTLYFVNMFQILVGEFVHVSTVSCLFSVCVMTDCSFLYFRDMKTKYIHQICKQTEKKLES